MILDARIIASPETPRSSDAPGRHGGRRPDDEAREDLLRRSLHGVAISEAEMKELVQLTGPRDGRVYGCTYSDLRQRFIPGAVLEAVDHGGPLTGELLIARAAEFVPTRPFDAEMAGAS